MTFFPLDIDIFRGDGWHTHCTFSVNGVATDVSGWLVMFTAKINHNQADADAPLKYDSVNDPTAIYFTDSGSGTIDRVNLDLLPADTDLMDPRNYTCDLQRVIIGVPWTFAFGPAKIRGDISRRVTA